MLTPEQLEKHKKYITGSKVASILELPGAYKSKYTLFAEMKGYTEEEEEPNERVKAGSYMEAGVAEWCKNEWGWDLIDGPPGGMFHPDYSFIYGLVDRLQKTDSKISHIIEIKNQDKFMESEWSDGPPEKFKAQLYLYMSIYGLPGRFAVCFGGNHFEQYELPQNPQVENFILGKCCEFWSDLQANRWPEADGSKGCSDALKLLFNDPGEKMVPGDQSLLDIAGQYKIFSAKEKAARDDKDRCGNLLKAAIANNQGLVFLDGSKATWKMTQPKKVQFNESQFERDFPELYKRYTFLPDGYRRLNVSLKGA